MAEFLKKYQNNSISNKNLKIAKLSATSHYLEVNLFKMKVVD